MSSNSGVLALWQKMANKPGGKQVFTRALCFKAPYFASIRPTFQKLEPGHAKVTIRKRRAVLNHIGTVHAIAMCNMAELAGGTMTEATIPRSHRWIPKGMTVEYLQKATTDLTATARADFQLDDTEGSEQIVAVDVQDSAGEAVFRAQITMWVSPKKPK